MTKSFLFFLIIIMLMANIVFISEARAEKKTKYWTKHCLSCHEGNTAPDAGRLSRKYKTADEFISAAKTKGSQCMNIVKNDEKVIRKIAREIGIKD